MGAVVDVGELEEDQPENRRAVFRGLEVGIGAEVVGSGPKVVFEFPFSGKQIDVRGISPGTLVRDPTMPSDAKAMFRVPPPE